MSGKKLHGIYADTLHWATTRNGFNSVLTIFNYLGWAFEGTDAADTDAEITVRFFDEGGHELAPYRGMLATHKSLHLSISDLHPDFQGMIAAAMTPRARIPRRTASIERPGRPIATSYFMLYERDGGFRDFSHELFLSHTAPDACQAEWATVLMLGGTLHCGVVVMNNRPLQSDRDCASDVAVQLHGLKGKPLSDAVQFALPPGGSRLIWLDELWGEAQLNDKPQVIATVRARNIEQPMSLHVHSSGDFNLHHF